MVMANECTAHTVDSPVCQPLFLQEIQVYLRLKVLFFWGFDGVVRGKNPSWAFIDVFAPFG